ncbi:MAG: tetratricopeptide repeat protein [Planctomycetales bacterium]|nr:tetratricopeptide repeat protein [Planctomycetales bacterium]
MVFRACCQCVLFACFVSCVSAASDVAPEIATAMQDRDFGTAISRIDEALKDETAPRDYLTYLKGRAFFYQQRYDDAVKTFDEFAKLFPESEWARQARFAKGLAFARSNDFESAERVFRADAESLLSNERKDEIAQIYLQFANGYFEPTDKNKQPDYAKAQAFFAKAIEAAPESKQRPETELKIGECLAKTQNWGEAINAFSAIIENYPDHSLELEARYRLGNAQFQNGAKVEARRTWQDLLAKFKSSDSKRIAEARYHLALTYEMPHPNNRSDLDLGVAAVRAFVAEHPDHELASGSYLLIANAYIHRGQSEEAATTLHELLGSNRYRESKEIAEARYLLGQVHHQQRRFNDAIKVWREYLSLHPSHNRWSTAQTQIIDSEFLQAQEKHVEKKYDEARQMWQAFLAKYPLDSRSRQIMLAFGQMKHAQKQYEAAIDDWRNLVTKYPQSDEASQAQFAIAATLEEELGKFDEALEEYKKLNWGSQQANAQQRISRLTAKQMTVRTERTFRNNETPSVKLISRNIEKVSVHAYQIDMSTYFRKMHLATNVESLDIALIDPDKTIEFEIPDYERYKETEFDIPLDVFDESTDGNVMVVTVSSDKLEATTMVIQSDLEIIVKSSRNELLVYAQNMRTGEPWANANLLLSNGSKVYAEVTTNDDGVFLETYDELRSTNDVRVFAHADGGNTASNVVSLRGLQVARGLADKGYIYTDRPVYRPGQNVNVRGIVRRVANDTYQIDEGRAFEMSVFDSRGRVIWSEDVTLNRFGSFHSNFAIPDSASNGKYRIQILDRDQKSFEGEFSVMQLQLQNIVLSIDTGRNVFYRGEKITGKISAKYYYGAPLANREIRYWISGDRVHTATTNAEGEVPFELETRDFAESQVLSLTAQMPEHNLEQTNPIVIATQGFSVAIDTTRQTYLAGESFEVDVTATDAEGEPVARAVTVRLVKRTVVAGRPGETTVVEKSIKTDEKNGLAHASFSVAVGGRYIVRVEGTDRFGNPVSGEHSVFVSGNEDDTRLRILADKHTYRVGDRPEITVHWREKPATALVTYEAANVLGYKIVRLETGSNNLQLPMSADMSPNFDLAVSVMVDARDESSEPEADSRRFHQTRTSFSVERDINVKVDLPKEVKPGGEIEIAVETTDLQGNPVESEVSLAMIERALIDKYGAKRDIVSQFASARRIAALRTASSIDFSYRPKTKAINERLLAESDRVMMEFEERRRLAELDFEVPTGGAIVAEAERASARMDGAFFDATEGNTVAIRQYADSAQTQQAEQFKRGQSTLGSLFESGQQTQSVISADRRYMRFSGEPAALGRVADQQQLQTQQFTNDQTRAWNKTNNFASNGVIAQFKNGEVVQYGRFAVAAGGQELLNELQRAGAVLRPNPINEETGYWNPAVVTDENGKATVKFMMPERSTAWNVVAQGITRETLVGSHESTVIAKKSLFGTLKLPISLTDGDRAHIMATIHNDGDEKQPIKVTLNTRIGDKKTTATQTVDSTESGTHELGFDLSFARPASAADRASVEVEFELLVSSGDRNDRFAQSVSLRPYGMSVFDVASGIAESDATAWIQLPESMPSRGATLQVIVGPSVENSLLNVLVAPPLRCQVQNSALAPASDSLTSDLLAAVGLQKLFGKSRDASGPQSAMIDSRIRSSIGSLIASQRDDGGWSWSGSQASNLYSTARVVWALLAAEEAGYSLPAELMAKAINYLQSEIVKVPNTDYESKAILLHALAVAGKDDFPLANRLYRNRQSLSTSGLVYLALTFAEMDRLPMAEEVLAVVQQRNLAEGTKLSGVSWNSSVAEVRALYAIALQNVSPKSVELEKQIDWLKSHRIGFRWAPDRATGPATLALCDWASKSLFESDRYEIELFVNDKLVKKMQVDKNSLTQTVDVPADLLVTGKQRVHFQINGRGRFTYQCVMEGFVSAEHLKADEKQWRVRRFYEAAPLERDGRTVPRGFDVVSGSYQSFRNELNELPVGKRGRVTLDVWRPFVQPNTPNEQLEYLVVTEPLPAGVSVVEDSVTGGFDRFEIGDGQITFFIGNRRGIGSISYDIHGFVSGDFKVAPSVIRDAYQLDRFAFADVKTVRVLPSGEKSSDEYRLTPRELLELGKRSFQREEWKEAITNLTDLVENWNLHADHYRDATQMLLDSHLAVGPADQVVRHFEVIKERWPEMEIAYDKILKIGAAYHDIGEFERSYLIFRATVQSSFLTESQVAGFLQSQNELRRSVEVMNQLIREYPPEAYIANATFDLAQEVYAMADKARTDEKLREAKITRVDLIREGMGMLNDFLTAYPNDPAADQAAFSYATALLDLKQYDAAISACERFVSRYFDSNDLDSFWYTIGYCHFASGNHQLALDVCKKVVDMKRKDPQTGRMVDAANRNLAIYILGQIHHSLGEASSAIEHYTRISDQFADAKEAIEYFMRRDISLPEVTSIRPGEQASVTLKFRNVAECETRVYKIDLMKFSLMHRNLSGITNINLAGINPLHQETITLGDGKDYRDRERSLNLPVKDEGAYLVVCRGDDLHTSGLVLVTPLQVDVQEDATSGRVRTTVKNAADSKYAADVHVKVIGTSNDDFIAGETDLRGLFVADGIHGKTTVIAQADGGRYAFYRGKTHLGEVANNAPQQSAEAKQEQTQKKQSRDEMLLENIRGLNYDIQRSNSLRQQDLYFNGKSGVTVESVK